MHNLKVYKVERCTYDPGFTMKMHKHEMHHLMFILSGDTKVTIDNELFDGRPQEYFLFSSGTFHSFTVVGKKPLHTIDVKFDINADNLLGIQLTQMEKRSNVFNDQAILSVLERLLKEAEDKLPFYIDNINAFCVNVLIQLLRETSDQNRQQVKEAADNNDSVIFTAQNRDLIYLKSIEKIVDYIHQNLNHSFTLKEFACMTNYSEVYFSEKFKSIYNCYPMQYIARLKLQKAKDMLKHTYLSLDEIAENLGFESREYFTKFFKKHQGIPPVTYRREHTKEIEIVL